MPDDVLPGIPSIRVTCADLPAGAVSVWVAEPAGEETLVVGRDSDLVEAIRSLVAGHAATVRIRAGAHR
jgi:hypothetical protein